MYVTKLLAIISCLWVDVQAWTNVAPLMPSTYCWEITQSGNKLQIKDRNGFITGGKQTRDGWYRTINWQQDYHKELWLDYTRKERIGTDWGGKPIWHERRKERVDICDLRWGTENGSWGVFFRELLGIPEGCPVFKGQRKVNGAIFAAEPCRNMQIFTLGGQEPSGQHTVTFSLTTQQGRQLLGGAIDMF